MRLLQGTALVVRLPSSPLITSGTSHSGQTQTRPQGSQATTTLVGQGVVDRLLLTNMLQFRLQIGELSA